MCLHCQTMSAHQGLSDVERRRLCKVIDFHKLSSEASAHAAQNERLPVQATVQVLYMEQVRLRNALGFTSFDDEQTTSHRSRHAGSGPHSAATSPHDTYASPRRENRELRLELARMRARLNDLERGHACMREDMEKSSSVKMVSSISRKIGKLSLFGRRA